MLLTYFTVDAGPGDGAHTAILVDAIGARSSVLARSTGTIVNV